MSKNYHQIVDQILALPDADVVGDGDLETGGEYSQIVVCGCHIIVDYETIEVVNEGEEYHYKFGINTAPAIIELLVASPTLSPSKFHKSLIALGGEAIPYEE